ncbi:adenine phosphoribosyltransferase [Halovulum dunhuangense]|uniref:Adenine phosphoribosyltransferase n=1 Tax=Halovulum dunhuangense TaxID=1505036 RepID=A0A849L0E4_9RHOB|nr:adenine phosphoribosyltransferase [Halovulum dunhuangense]NNU79736.1 adenine phosphoribosyltransferase [Halovulum dunhuangense]
MPTPRDVKSFIRTIPDFPQPGIMFRDVTTLFQDARGFRMAIDQLLHPYAGIRIDKVAGLEARGFILGGAVAHQLSVGFVPIRKKGKLPARTIEQAYALEYGEAVMEVHDDAIQPGDRVLLVDDLLATGGTAEAGVRLIEQLGGEVASTAFIIELPELGGRKRLEALGLDVHALCAFEGH